jgi:hypothetical protein
MKFSVLDLRNERQWRSAIGMNKERFIKLLESFTKHYREQYGMSLKERQIESTIDYCINSEEELLLYTLFSLKSGLTYDLLGLVSGMDGSNAKRNQNLGLEILGKTLSALACMPKRNFMNVKEFEAHFANIEQLIMDASEQPIQRPSEQETQEKYYSGKKKTHA